MSRGGDDSREAAGSSRLIQLTSEQQERFATLTPRERFKDAEHQRWAQSHRSRESLAAGGHAGWKAMVDAHGRQALSEAGKLGWATTVTRYGEEFAFDRLAESRRDHPTRPEQQMIALLAELGQRDGQDYQREYKIAPKIHVDVAWPDLLRALEVYGGVHFGPFFDPDGARAAHDAQRVARIQAQGWQVVVVTSQELTRSRWEETRARVQSFLSPLAGETRDGSWGGAAREAWGRLGRAFTQHIPERSDQ